MDGIKWTMKKILNDNYKCEGQMSIFDFIPYPEPKTQRELPCDTCGHDIKGCCDYDYINNHDYCVLGDKWIPKAPEEGAAAPTEDFMNPPEEAAKAADQTEEKPKNNPIVIPGAVADVLTRELDAIEKSMQELEDALEIQKSRYRQISTFIKSPEGWNLSQTESHGNITSAG